MKKKFVLTLALVLMVAATLVAATPLEVSGSFKSGYDVVFGSGGVTGSIANDHKTTISADFTGDFWKVSLTADPTAIYGANKAVNANAELYLHKALKDEGVDLGDVAVTLHVGSGVGKGVYSVLADKAGFRDVAIKGTSKKVEGVFANNFGVTLGYGTLVKVYASVDPTSDGAPFVVAAQTDPVDGVTAAVGFTNAWVGDKALTTSVKADVKKLADLDFDLAATAEFIYDVDQKDSIITADVAGGWEGITGYVAYQMTAAKKHQLAARAGYETEIENVGIDGGVKFVTTDVEDLSASWNVVVDASASYALGGATYSLGAEYDVKAKAFTLSPAVAISF